MIKIKPLYAMICDDIRTEDNGKSIILGVYTGDIQITNFPARLSLSTWLAFTLELDEELDSPVNIESRLKVEFSDIDEKAAITTAHIGLKPKLMAKNTHEKKAKIHLDIPLKNAILNIPAPGILTLSIRLQDRRWIEVLTKDISKGTS